MPIDSTVLKIGDAPVGIAFKLESGNVLSLQLKGNEIETSVSTPKTSPLGGTQVSWKSLNTLETGSSPVTVDIGEFKTTASFAYQRNGRNEDYSVFAQRDPFVWLQHTTSKGGELLTCNTTLLDSRTGAPNKEIWGSSIGTMEMPMTDITGSRDFDRNGHARADNRSVRLRILNKLKVQGYESLVN